MTFNTPLEIGMRIPFMGWEQSTPAMILGFKYGKHGKWLVKVTHRTDVGQWDREWFAVETVEKWAENAAKGKE